MTVSTAIGSPLAMRDTISPADDAPMPEASWRSTSAMNWGSGSGSRPARPWRAAWASNTVLVRSAPRMRSDSR